RAARISSAFAAHRGVGAFRSSDALGCGRDFLRWALRRVFSYFFGCHESLIRERGITICQCLRDSANTQAHIRCKTHAALQDTCHFNELTRLPDITDEPNRGPPPRLRDPAFLPARPTVV